MTSHSSSHSEASSSGSLEKIWVRPLKNAGKLGSGKAAQGVMTVIALALAARQLGPESFGYFVLIHGMIFGLSQIGRAQSWQAVLRYGAQSLANEDIPRFTRLLRFCTSLDLIAAVTGGIIVVTLSGPLAGLFNLPPDQIWLAQSYALLYVLIVITPTQLGVLRLLDRFDLVAWQTTIAPSLRLAGAAGLWFWGQADLWHYLAVWFAGGFVARGTMIVMAARVLKSQYNIGAEYLIPLFPLRASERGLWRYILSHNFGQSLYISQDQLGLFLVGWLFGPAAAGIFKIAQKLADILVKPASKMLVPALYPELARFEARPESAVRSRMLGRVMAVIMSLAVLIGVVLVLAGPLIIEAVAGRAYLSAYEPMLWLCAAGIITVAAHPLEPYLSASSHLRALVFGYAAGFAVYVLALIWLSTLYGLSGAAAATLCSVLVSTLIMLAGGGIKLWRPDREK